MSYSSLIICPHTSLESLDVANAIATFSALSENKFY